MRRYTHLRSSFLGSGSLLRCGSLGSSDRGRCRLSGSRLLYTSSQLDSAGRSLWENKDLVLSTLGDGSADVVVEGSLRGLLGRGVLGQEMLLDGGSRDTSSVWVGDDGVLDHFD